MNEDFFILLLYKRLKGEINQVEQSQLNEWLAADPVNRQNADAIEQAWNLSATFPQPLTFDLDKEFGILQDRIRKDEIQSQPARRIRFLQALKYAAAIAVLLVAGALLWNNFLQTEALILTTTGVDEVKDITLPDGSVVWLNENTSISYPENFENQRKIQLEGEAFFEVKRNQYLPFVVETSHTTTTVLGTSFYLKALQDKKDNMLIVKTGKVRFQPKFTEVFVDVSANQTSSFNAGSSRLEPPTQVKDYNALFWKTGEWFFDNVSLGSIQAELRQRFQVELKINESLQKCNFTSTFRMDDSSIEQGLNNMANVFGATLKKGKANTYQLVGGACN